MANWNLSFDYAAVFFLLLILVWFFNEKMVPLRSHRAFLVLLINALASTVLEIVTTWMGRNMDIVGYNAFFFALTLSNFAINITSVTFTFYILQLAHIDILKNKIQHFLFRAAIAANIVVLALNFRLHWAFTFEDGVYRFSYASLFLYAIDAVMLTICVVTMIRFRKNFQFLRVLPLIFTLVFCVIMAMLQLIAYIPMLNLMITSVCMTLFHYQQNAGTVTDMVTKQFNRRFLREYLYSIFSEKKPFGVIAVAMDDFKFINRTYGAEIGDDLLFQVGKYLGGLRASGTVFRLGSDQFYLVIDKRLSQLPFVAEEIRERFHQPWFTQNGTSVMMSASLCYIECPKDADSYDSMIDTLDYSVSFAKKTKKGGITYVGDLDLSKLRQEKMIEKAIQLAMDRDELMVYYQPIFSVEQGVYNSAEALVRLNDEALGWISPEDFIPIAEKNGMIVEMGEMILSKVCRFIRDFRLSDTTVQYIEVNISPVQLRQPGFADKFKRILEDYNVKPQQINIEITEMTTINSSVIVQQNIQNLVDFGIIFSLDDYGSGNANIDYINHMPFKLIKIDKYIIWDSFKSRKAGITLAYTIGMLNALELCIVAEGVETEEMRDHLAKVGCHYLQGWYYSKAVPDQEFIQLLRRPIVS